MAVVVPEMLPLEVHCIVAGDALIRCNDRRELLRSSQKEPAEGNESPRTPRWVTFRESKDAAWERSSWHTADNERFLVKVTFTPKGIGHYMRSELLTRVPQHGTWRFHGDVPFEVRDSAGDLLLQVEDTTARVVRLQ